MMFAFYSDFSDFVMLTVWQAADYCVMMDGDGGTWGRGEARWHRETSEGAEASEGEEAD